MAIAPNVSARQMAASTLFVRHFAIMTQAMLSDERVPSHQYRAADRVIKNGKGRYLSPE